MAVTVKAQALLALRLNDMLSKKEGTESTFARLRGLTGIKLAQAIGITKLLKEIDTVFPPIAQRHDEILNKVRDEPCDETENEYQSLLDEDVQLDVSEVVLPADAEGLTPEDLSLLDGMVTVDG